MKTGEEKVITYKTYYQSDDGCFKSYSKEAVEDYERRMEKVSSNHLMTTKVSDSPDLSDWRIYRCDNRDEYLCMISTIVAKEGRVSDSSLQSCKKAYKDSEKYYAIRVEDCCGDSWNELMVMTAQQLIRDYQYDIAQHLDLANRLKTECEIISETIIQDSLKLSDTCCKTVD